MLRTFNCGIGFVAVRPHCASAAVDAFHAHGERAFPIGIVERRAEGEPPSGPPASWGRVNERAQTGGRTDFRAGQQSSFADRSGAAAGFPGGNRARDLQQGRCAWA